ncbi:MAG: hypothetical protein B6D37_05045 [Sphingobacteriales bacterium UTBCD1]|jgi:hypothetical protein|nr:MAG: hypothetical protein B6D37_05045 [Sphingobacteriales bacterium UTBCD1]
MKIKIILAIISLLYAEISIHAQKALPITLNALLARVHSPVSSQESFQLCTKETDTASGLISVKDAGAEVNGLQQTVANDMTQLSTATMSSSYSSTSTSMPTAEQMEQMKNMTPDQAMKMAKQQPNNASQTNNKSLMQEFGKAEDAGMKINLLINELSTKVSQLSGELQQELSKVKLTGSCEEYKVQGADIALPKCSCVKNKYFTFHTQRVAAADQYLQKLNALFQKYFPDIKNDLAVIDKAESDSQYGDALTIPVYKQRAVTLQQQALGSMAPILGMVSNAIKDTAKEYADVTNITNGHLPEPCQ